LRHGFGGLSVCRTLRSVGREQRTENEEQTKEACVTNPKKIGSRSCVRVPRPNKRRSLPSGARKKIGIKRKAAENEDWRK
jgi:hypothetical protein